VAIAPVDYRLLNARLIGKARELLQSWFPKGKPNGSHFYVGNLQGEPGKSLSIDLATGAWHDFADESAKGGDLISLYAAMHQISQSDAARALDPHVDRKPAECDIEYIPEGQWPPPHPKLGAPEESYLYRDEHRRGLYVQSRYRVPGDPGSGTDPGKTFLPWRRIKQRWVPRGTSSHVPYRLPEVLAAQELPVWIFEGERKADRCAALIDTAACTAWCNGAAAVRKTDWFWLTGRTVVLWPDNDAPGRDAMVWLGSYLAQRACTVLIVAYPPDSKPEGWDIADAIAEGWVARDINAFCEQHCKPFATRSLQSAAEANWPDPVPEPSPPHSGGLAGQWERWGFTRDGRGRPHGNLHNVARFVEASRHERPNDFPACHWDQFRNTVFTFDDQQRLREWEDSDTLALQQVLQTDQVGLYTIGRQTVADAVLRIACQHMRNEPREWFESLKWDGTYRLEQMLNLGWGVKPSAYACAVGRCFVTSMVARVYSPGCKADHMPVFEGPEGRGKTEALIALVGKRWYDSGTNRVGRLDFYQCMRGKLLIELEELAQFQGVNPDAAKAEISRQTDYYRASYGHVSKEHPRMCVFAGSTNRDDWNRSETGMRRMWPVECGVIDLQWISSNRQQLFAEAVHRYKEGENWHEVPVETARELQDDRRDVDLWENAIRSYLVAHKVDRIKSSEILGLALLITDARDHTQAAQKRLGKVMRSIGWRSVTVREREAVFRAWIRVTSVTSVTIATS
jgi:predicted P-loop ATPase